MDAVVKKVCLDLDRSLVLSTRVDTGRARGGWGAGVNNVSLRQAIQDPSGAITLRENAGEINKAKAGDTIYLTNNVEYIVYLNDGTDKFSGDFMVEKSLRRFPQIIRESTNQAKREHP